MASIKRNTVNKRVSFEELKAKGILKKSKACKICKSPHYESITKDLLSGLSGNEVIRRYNQLPYFTDKPLNAANISNHRRHCNPRALAKTDYQKMLANQARYSDEVKALYQQRYDATFNKLKTVDDMYRQRLRNLWELQRELETLKTVDETSRSKENIARIQDLTMTIDASLHMLTQDVLRNIQVEQGPQKNVNVIFVNNVKSGIEDFIEAFVDVLITEIDDAILCSRLKDKFIEKADEFVAPLLDDKQINGSIEIISNSKK